MLLKSNDAFVLLKSKSINIKDKIPPETDIQNAVSPLVIRTNSDFKIHIEKAEPVPMYIIAYIIITVSYTHLTLPTIA